MRSDVRRERLAAWLGDAAGARWWRAPGRVNIIGEHVDYLGGPVLPFACDVDVLLAAIPDAGVVTLDSLDTGQRATVPLGGRAPEGLGRWAHGVAAALTEAGWPVEGFRGVVASSIPMGAGLSSSAALAAVVAMALTRGRRPPAGVLRRAEHLATGVPCGAMDHVAALHGRAGHAIALDCRTGSYEHVRLPDDLEFLVVDTGTRRRLDDGRYAARRMEAERATEAARDLLGADPVDVGAEAVERAAGRLEPVDLRRLRHVVTECARARRATDALRAGDAAVLGAAMNASHASLRDDFEVSSPELDLAVATVRRHPACFGARLVGAGFAGCVLAAVRAGTAADVGGMVERELSAARAFGVHAVDGAGEV